MNCTDLSDQFGGHLLRIKHSCHGRYGDSDIQQTVRNALIDAQIGILFWHEFPREWYASTKATGIKREPNERQDELLALLGRFMPVDEIGMGWDIDERPTGIPVWRLSVPFDDEWTLPEELERRSTAELVMACLIGIWGSDDVVEYLAQERGFTYAFPTQPDRAYVDPDLFRKACASWGRKQSGGLWRKLPDAIWTVGHGTGNFMLDYEDDTAEHFWEHVENLGWTLKGYRRLKRECDQAAVLLTTLKEVCAWLDAEPDRWAEIFVLWDTSYRRRPARKWRSLHERRSR